MYWFLSHVHAKACPDTCSIFVSILHPTDCIEALSDDTIFTHDSLRFSSGGVRRNLRETCAIRCNWMKSYLIRWNHEESGAIISVRNNHRETCHSRHRKCQGGSVFCFTDDNISRWLSLLNASMHLFRKPVK